MAPSYPSTDRVLTPAPKRSSIGIFLLGLLIGTVGVAIFFVFFTKVETVQAYFAPPIRPYAAYLESLENSQVAESVMGQAWIEAGIESLNDTTQLLPPHLESGYIDPLAQQVISFQIKPRRGQLLSIQLELIEAVDSPQVFIELFEKVPEQYTPRLVAFADSGSYRLEYEVEEDEIYQLRMQPELLARFSYRLQVVLGASLAFPVEGKDSRAIRSFWGDSRDGGRRKHKGIDIFAKRGTPVLAAKDGRISRVKEGGLGGKVVWQREVGNHYSLYYAHLDTQLVRQGQIVRAGDTVGLIGNTGNARYTPPHLHFGIYQRRRGAVDPFPFVDEPSGIPPALVAADSGMLVWHRLKNNAKLYVAPSTTANLIRELPTDIPIQRLAATGNWHRVRLVDGTIGFISHRNTYESVLDRLTLEQEVDLLDQVEDGISKDHLAIGTELEILAQTTSHQYVRTREGELGFVRRDVE